MKDKGLFLNLIKHIIMKKFVLVCFALILLVDANAQNKDDKSTNALNVLNPDNVVTTNHTVTIKGNSIPYKAIAGTIPVWNDSGKITAGVFFTYYERNDIQDRTSRPLVISFNGGPGTPSVWMELGYTGPRMLNINDEGYPIQPYGVKENPFSLIDKIGRASCRERV